MVQIIERKISKEMAEAGRGSILHDGWTKYGIHFVCLYACYMKKVIMSSLKSETKSEQPQLVLLACSPMYQIEDEDEANNEDEEEDQEEGQEGKIEAVKFTATVHANFIKKNLKFSKISSLLIGQSVRPLTMQASMLKR